MKTTKDIIAELCLLNHYKPLKFFFECDKFIKTLRSDIRKNLLSKSSRIYIINDTLVINAKNNACLQDLTLQSNKNDILKSLYIYQKLLPNSALENIKQIKYTVSKFKNTTGLNFSKVKFYTPEHSDGRFDNILKNEKARHILDEIKTQIQKNNKDL